MHLDIQRSVYKETISPLISAVFKGVSQVIFIENAFTGLLITIAIMFSSVSLGIIALLSSLIAVLIGRLGGANRTLINQGLLGYNSVLAGIAISLNLQGGIRFVIAMAGAVVAALFTVAIMQLMEHLNVPALTFPYIIMTWFLLLASYRLGVFRLNPNLTPQDLSHLDLHFEGTMNWIEGTVSGVGQVFFQDTFWSGILILIGIFWAGWKLGLYAVLGSVVAMLTAYFLGAEVSMLNSGLYGFNAVLTMLAVGVVFDAKSRFAPITGIIAAIVSVPITASVTTWMMPYGLPTLTMPFVLSTWLFLAARKALPNI